MKKKIHPVVESVSCLESSKADGNVIRNVKCLGIYSKNGRVYPLEVMRKALPKYEGVVVNLDHKPNEPRSVLERFGKIVNVRMGDDGIYGDLEYNPHHSYAKAFEYFAENQPDIIGLSHAAIAKTKLDHRSGVETVEDITELESVDLVANAATNKTLFESYTQILESMMKKPGKKKLDEQTAPAAEVHEAEVVQEEVVAEAEKVEEATLVLPGKHVYVPESMMDKEYESYESFCKEMKEAILGVMKSDLSEEEKADHCMALMAPKKKEEAEEKPAEQTEEAIQKDVLMLDSEEKHESDDADADDKVTKQKAEESIRKSDKLGFKLLLEELDAYRTRDAHERQVAKIMDFCKAAGLAEKLVTEAFIDVLAAVPEAKWKSLVEDRKNVSTNYKNPVSFSSDAGRKELTVDELVKQLRSN